MSIANIEEIKLQKKEQRAGIKRRIAKLTKEEKSAASEVICAGFLATEAYKKANSIFCYLSIEDEVNTDMIIEKAFADGKRVGVPLIRGGEMTMVEVFPDTRFYASDLGIKEPLLTEALESADVVAVPLRGFDKALKRLGRSGGHYDRFLRNNKSSYAIGLAFSVQEEKKIVTDKTDTKLDMVITEKETFKG